MRNLSDLKRYEPVREWMEYAKITPFYDSLLNSPSVKKLLGELENVEERKTSENDNGTVPNGISANEHSFRLAAVDYCKRFSGHCNTTTDIKEAVFLGGGWMRPEFVAAGSDDGSIYIWSSETTNIVRILKGDSSIVNCIAPHKEFPIMATSGIDNVVRVWEPQPNEEDVEMREQDRRSSKIGSEVTDITSAAENNAQRMARDPIDHVFMQIHGGESEEGQGPMVLNCNTQ